jgi:hypothetical protein
VTPTLALVGLLQAPTALFEQSLTAYARLPVLRARIELAQVTQRMPQRSTISIDSGRAGLVMRVQEAAKPGLDRVDRTYRVVGTHFEAYDSVARERLSRDVPPIGSPADRMAFALGALEEGPATLLKRERMVSLFTRLKAVRPWEISTGAGLTMLTYRSGSTRTTLAFARLAFGTKDKLLRELLLRTGPTELHWTITYGTPVPYTPPPTSRLVSAFMVAEAPPTFANGDARKLYERMIDAADSLRSGVVAIRDQDGATTLKFQGTWVRQMSGPVTWAYDGTTLSLLRADRKRFYRGKCSAIRVPDLVSKLGGRADSFARYLLYRKAPFRDVTPTGARVSVAGSLTVGGTSATILRATAPRKRVSMAIASTHHLPVSITAEFLDASGKVLTTTTRGFQFSHLNGRLPTAEFRIAPPRGVKVERMPKSR